MDNGKSTVKIWENCYDDSWKDLITPESFSHPAKFSRGLIQRIYQYCLEQGYFSEGMTIIDPFGGTGLGAIATHYGLNWLGNELEPRFCKMAWSWDCPDIKQEDYDNQQCESSQDWHKLDLGCCSECIYKAIEGQSLQRGLFEQESYFTEPHRYHGNLELFERYAKDRTWARLMQGDSRKLGEMWGAAGGLDTSPPFSDVTSDRPSKSIIKSGLRMGQGSMGDGYGSSQGQLANLPEGLVSSSPFAGNTGGKGKASRDGIDPALFDRHGGGMVGGMHGEEGNLEGLEPGDLEGLVSSPPFTQQKRFTEDRRSDKFKMDKDFKAGESTFTDYGDSEGQLGAMSEGLVSSPPFEDTEPTQDDNFRYQGQKLGTTNKHYGSTPNNIGNDSGPTFWQAAQDIILECHRLLAPNSIAVFVTKNYIKSGKEVDFTGNWIALCQSCGFELIEQKRAMLVKNLGTQLSYSGDDKEITIERKSFFRRLHERRRPDLRIDWESVLFFRRM